MHKTSAAGAILAVLSLANIAAAPPRPMVRVLWDGATADLQASIKRDEKAGRDLPRLTSPEVRNLFQEAFDEQVLPTLGNDLLDFIDTSHRDSVCDVSIGLALAYGRHGLGPSAIRTLGASSDATMARIMRNNVIYQDEQTRAFAFATACFGTQISIGRTAYAQIPASLIFPTSRQGALLMVQNAPTLYHVIVSTLRDPKISLANKTLLLDRAAQYADAYATVLAPAERKSVIGVVDALAPTAPPPLRVKLTRIHQAMATPCKGLCA
ncbi:MAG: hypothetical protein WA840_20695 [Caulobacteraceae bacterium]